MRGRLSPPACSTRRVSSSLKFGPIQNTWCNGGDRTDLRPLFAQSTCGLAAFGGSSCPAPDGVDYENRIVYDEIVKPERLVYSHGGGGDVEPVQFQVTVTFEDHDGKTKLTMKGLFPSAAERDRVAEKYGAVEGAKQTLERLAEHLATMG